MGNKGQRHAMPSDGCIHVKRWDVSSVDSALLWTDTAVAMAAATALKNQ